MSRRRSLLAALVALGLLALLVLRALGGRPEPGMTLARPAPFAAPPALPVPSLPSPPHAALSPPSPPPSATAPSTPDPARAPGAASAPDAPAVRAALAGLDGARAAAFAEPVTGDPDAWALRTCACHEEDVRRLRDLARAGLALRGHAATVTSVNLVAARADPTGEMRVETVVADRVGAYTAVDASGRVVRRWPATGSRRWRLTLVRSAGRWRYGAVARAP